MSELVSGGNVSGNITSFNQLPRRAKLTMFAPFLLPLLLIWSGATMLITALGKDLSASVTSTAASLAVRTINPDSGGSTGQAFSYLSFGTSLLLLYGFMVLPFFSKRFRLSPRRSFLLAVGVGFVILVGSFWIRPANNAQLQIMDWGQQQLKISDLTEYTAIKADISQTFTVTNDEGKKVTFSLTTRADKNYLYTTYAVVPN